MKAYDIVCVGEISRDVIGTTKAFVDTGTLLDNVYNGFGGRAANVAVYASLFSKKCLIVSPVGRDFEQLGGFRYLRSLGMETDGVYVNDKVQTSLAVIVSNVNDVRVSFYEGPWQKAYLECKRHVMDTLLHVKYRAIVATASRPDMNEAVLKNARKGALRVFMPSHEISYYTTKQLEECLRNCDLVRFNRAQVGVVEKKLKMDIYSVIKKFKLRAAALTDVRNGITVFAKYSGTFIPVCVPKAEVDATGAGDSFTGAFIANYLDTSDEVYAGRMAASTASFVVEHIGVQVNLPTKKQVMERAKTNYGNLKGR